MKKWLINLLAGSLFKLVSENDFYRVGEKGTLIHRGRVLTDVEKHRIISEAKFLQSSETLLALLAEMIYVANKRIYFDSKDATDMLGGKMVLWTIDVLVKKIDNLSKLK